MDILIVSSHGQLCDKITRSINTIYPNQVNYFEISDDILDVRSKLTNHTDILFVDYNLNGYGYASGMELIDQLVKDVRFNMHNVKSVLIALPEDQKKIEKFQNKHGHWFRYIFKNFDDEHLRIALR